MTASVYTAITFAPVQGFIEKSRKLRDLYGSSFILSYLARAICDAATAAEQRVISPANINVTRGTPNQIVIAGDFSKSEASRTFLKAWKAIVNVCRAEIEDRLPESKLLSRYTWKRAWDAWSNHAWEFFWAQGQSIGDARRRLNEVKRSRAWTGINWHGESSTLSGADAIAWYGMTDQMRPTDSVAKQYSKISAYCKQLSQALPHSIIDETEQLSIPELIKRVLMLKDRGFPKRLRVQQVQLGLPAVEPPKVYTEFNRFEEDRWTGWFQGDGDSIGKFLQSKGGDDPEILNAFSHAMLVWGEQFQSEFDQANGRVIYAGGDDFLGVFYRNEPDPPLSGLDVLKWFRGLPEIWGRHNQRDAHGNLLTVSVGLVWAAPQVPQRDVLQHCKDAEQAAKQGGRDRLCIRILFSGGNNIEWICPWWFLAVVNDYRDRHGTTGEKASWGHFFEDVATLEARHAFRGQTDVALELFGIYFGCDRRTQLAQHYWDDEAVGTTGILGNEEISPRDTTQRLNQWVINLAKVGFHLHRHLESISTPSTAAKVA